MLHRGAAIALWLGMSSAGCAGAARAPEAPSPPQATEPAAPSAAEAEEAPPQPTLPEAEAQLAAAQAELEGLFQGVAAVAPPPPAERQPATTPGSADSSADAARASGGAAAPTGSSPKASPQRCVAACKAFASLSRAVDAICRLSEDAAQCERARRTREEQARRVAVCGCSAEP